VTCQHCGASIESTATTCPVCGSAVPAEASTGEGQGVLDAGTDAAADPSSGDAAPTDGGAGRAGDQAAGHGQGGYGHGGHRQEGYGQGGYGHGGHGQGGYGHGGHGQGGYGAGPAGDAGPGTTGAVWDQGTGGAYDPYGGAGAAGLPPGGTWGQPQPHPSGLPSDVRGWGVAAHASAYLALIGLPVLGPLLVWLLKRDHPFVDHHGKEALNFNLSVLVYAVVLTVIAVPIGFVTFGIGLIPIGIVIAVIAVLWFVFPAVGAVKASNGEGYRYPMTIRFVR